MTDYLKIDSSARSSGSYGKLTIKSKHILRGRYALRQAYIPIDYYNVNSYNNSILFFENGVTKTATIAPGYHNDSTIIATVKAAMDAASGGYNTFTVTMNGLSRKIQIEASTHPFELRFAPLLGNQSSAAILLGFDAKDYSGSLIHVSDRAANLSPVRSFNITINGAGRMVSSQGATFSFTVPITGISGALQVYEPSSQFPQVIILNDAFELECSITDEKNNILELQSDWYLILEHLDY